MQGEFKKKAFFFERKVTGKERKVAGNERKVPAIVFHRVLVIEKLKIKCQIFSL